MLEKLEKPLTQFNEHVQACRNTQHKPNFSKQFLENQHPISMIDNIV